MVDAPRAAAPAPPPPLPPPPQPLPRSVWLLCWVSFFADVSGEMAYPLLPLFLVGVLGAERTWLGAMEGAAVLLVALMSAWAGMRSDRGRNPGGRGGRVPWVRWGYGLPVLGKTLIASASGWPLLLGGRLLDRLGKGLRGAPRDALIADAVPAAQRGQAFGLHRAFDTTGALLGVLLAAALLWLLTGTPRGAATSDAPGWVYRAVFGVAAALGLLSCALTFALREDPAPVPSSAAPAPAVAPTVAPTAPRVGWRTLPRGYWAVLLVLTLFALANSSDTFLLLRARELGCSPWAVVLVYAVTNVGYAALSYPAGVLSDRLGRWRLIALGWLVYAAVYAGLALLPAAHAWGLWPLMAVYGCYLALTDGVGKALIADHAPRAARGAAMGVYYAATGSATLLASVVTGAVWDRAGATPALLLGAACAALALLALPVAARHAGSGRDGAAP